MYIDRIVYSYTVYIYIIYFHQYLWVAVDFLQASVEQLKTLISEESQAPNFGDFFLGRKWGFHRGKHGDLTVRTVGISPFHHPKIHGDPCSSLIS